MPRRTVRDDTEHGPDNAHIDDYAHYVHIDRTDYDHLATAVHLYDNDIDRADNVIYAACNLVHNHDN